MFLIRHPFATDRHTHTHTPSSNPCSSKVFVVQSQIFHVLILYFYLFLHSQDINSCCREKNHLNESQLQPIPWLRHLKLLKLLKFRIFFDPNFNFDEWPGSSEPYLSDHSYLFIWVNYKNDLTYPYLSDRFLFLCIPLHSDTSYLSSVFSLYFLLKASHWMVELPKPKATHQENERRLRHELNAVACFQAKKCVRCSGSGWVVQDLKVAISTSPSDRLWFERMHFVIKCLNYNRDLLLVEQGHFWWVGSSAVKMWVQYGFENVWLNF